MLIGCNLSLVKMIVYGIEPSLAKAANQKSSDACFGFGLDAISNQSLNRSLISFFGSSRFIQSNVIVRFHLLTSSQRNRSPQNQNQTDNLRLKISGIDSLKTFFSPSFFVVLACHELVPDGFDQLLSFALSTL